MSKQPKAITVMLNHDSDIEKIIHEISLINGVECVGPDSLLLEHRIIEEYKTELKNKIDSFLY